MSLTIKLGTSTNLIKGFNPDWIPGDKEKTGLFFTKEKPLVEKEITPPPSSDAKWGYPQITMHDNAETLLSSIFPFRIANASDGLSEAELQTGALLINDHDKEQAVAKLSAAIGVDLSQNWGYALVQIKRIDGIVEHPITKSGITVNPNPVNPDESLGVEKSFQSELRMIRKLSDKNSKFNVNNLTTTNVQNCLDLYQSYGTHFVSSALFGDTIFQIFAYKPDRYEIVKRAFEQNDFSEEESANFLIYVSDSNKGPYGYVKQYGKILSFSGSKVLADDLKSGAWADSLWSGTDCIFAPLIRESVIGYKDLNSRYKDMAPVSYLLTTTAIFAEFNRRAALKHVYAGAMVQKFRKAVDPKFSQNFPYNIAQFPDYSNVNGLISNIATKDINTYTTTLDFDNLTFVAPEICSTFTLCSNLATSSSGNIHIPGNDIVLAVQAADFERDHGFTTAVIKDQAFDSCHITCHEFYGCLQIIGTSLDKCETILSGVRMVYHGCDEDGRYLVSAKDDIRTAPDAKHISRLKDSLTFSYTFADSVLSTHNYGTSKSQICLFAEATMEWLASIIPGNCSDLDMMDIRVLALDALRMQQNNSYSAYVPILDPMKYQQYTEKIISYIDEITRNMNQCQQEINARKTQELIIDTGNALNSNIIESGKLLSGIIKTDASQQKELASYYDSIILEKQAELEHSVSIIYNLSADLMAQEQRVKSAVEIYKKAVEDWQTRESIKAALEFATLLFNAGTSVLVPSTAIDDVKDLGLLVQRINKLLNVLNNVYDLYYNGYNNQGNLQYSEDALEEMKKQSFDVDSSINWNELAVNMSYILNLGPELAEKYLLNKEFYTFVLRGKALINAQETYVQLSKEIYTQQRQKELSKKQQERLDQLCNSLLPANLPSLNPQTLDLAGLTGRLVYLRTQMFGILAKAFHQQDQALQYKNLQPPTLIGSYDLLSFKASVVRQEQNTIVAISKLASVQESVTGEIPLTFNIDASELSSGKAYPLTIYMDNPNFMQYVNVRIKSAIVEIDGIASTTSGKYLVKLAYPGYEFSDRDMDRNPLSFKTELRERIYQYDTVTNKPDFTDKGESWSKEVSAVTPFSTWEISLPNTSINKGLKFKDSVVKVTLKLILNARIIDAQAAIGGRMSRALPSLNKVLTDMKDRSVVNGWDAVFNMSLNKIQKVLDKQYEALKQNTSYGGKIDASDTYHDDDFGETVFSLFKLEYGYPQLLFSAIDPQRVTLNIPITGGYTMKGRQEDGSDEIRWGKKNNVTAGATIQASVPIESASGIVNQGTGDSSKILSVILDLAKGAFTSSGMNIVGSDNTASFNKAMVEYFIQNKVVFIINSLDLTGISVLDDLRPSGFRFKTLVTPNNNQILQLFITTSNRSLPNASQTFLNGVDEPIPIDNECSLMLSSKIFFNSILTNSLISSNFRIASIDPSDKNKSWKAKFYNALLKCPMDISSMNFNSGSFDRFEFTLPKGTVDVNLNDMMISPNIEMISTEKVVQGQEEYIEDYQFPAYLGGPMVHHYTNKKSDYSTTISTAMPVKIGGTGRNQTIKVSMDDIKCDVNARLSGGGDCGADDMNAKFNQILVKTLPDFIKKTLGDIDFKEMSLFALKNLLFVNDDYIKFNAAKIPGDVLITGIFINN